MIFNSLTFLVFFAVVLAMHNMPFSWHQKKINLMIASYLFYAAWNPPFVILLWISTVVDWWAAQWLVRAKQERTRRIRMLVGVAVCLGFAMPDNFRFPYGAIGFSDFWRHWHITLSSWLRDYLYIPLGGNRHGQARTYAALMGTMLLGGLWHGANWTFVVWGGL